MVLSVAREKLPKVVKSRKIPRDTRKHHEYLMAVVRTSGTILTLLLQCITLYLLLGGKLI